MITTRETRLNLSTNLSYRVVVPSGTTFSTLARIYGGKVLKVGWGGQEWYTANPDWAPEGVTESVQPPVLEAVVNLPWDRKPKRGRGRPKKTVA